MICTRCDQEVRWGGSPASWLHREPVDHVVKLPLPSWRLESHLANVAPAPTDAPRVDKVDERDFDIPEPTAAHCEVALGSLFFDHVGGARILAKAVLKAGGRYRAWFSHAPKIHASQGHVLGMVDYLMVKFECEGRTGVAMWEDGGLDIAYLTDYDPTTRVVVPTRVTGKELRAWLTKAERE